MHIHCSFDLLKLCHHIFINVKTSRCIQDHDVISILARMLKRRFCDISRLVFISHGEYFHALLLSVDLQLFNRCRTIHITRNKQWFLAFQLVLACQLCSSRGLTCTLKSCHHDHRDCTSRLQFDLRRLRTHQIYKFFIYDLDHHLSRIQSVHHILSDCSLLHIFYKLLYDFKVYIRLQKCHLHFFQCRLYIIFRQTTFASEILKYVLKFFC